MNARFHLFETDDGPGLLVADGTRIHSISDDLAKLLTFAATARPELIDEIFSTLGLDVQPIVEVSAASRIRVRAFSLAIAQKCNLGCTYCYASGGTFGGPARSMSDEVSGAAVRRLFSGTSPGERVQLAFLGGEPFANRRGLKRATELAAQLSRESGVEIAFSVTTNGTLITEEDADFLASHRFSVTVSLDGVGEVHDRLRAYKNGRGSFRQISTRLKWLIRRQEEIDLAARVTVTPRNLNLLETLTGLTQLGFRTVGFSPMLRSPTGDDQMREQDLELMLQQMIACGREFEEHLLRGQRHAFSNLASALRELHRGTHRPYPCGAGAGYLGVAADGKLAACHRFVEEPGGGFGDVEHGVDYARQQEWLTARRVEHQEPCRDCWARYLCGGGCHHEVIHGGRPACDYIRGWLTYCLQSYVRLQSRAAWWFGSDEPAALP